MRAVRKVLEHEADPPSPWATGTSIAERPTVRPAEQRCCAMQPLSSGRVANTR